MIKYSHQFHCMTTPCEVILYSETIKKAKKVARSIEKNTKRLEKKYNFFSPNSFLSALNNRSESSLIIDRETCKILKQVRKLSEKTNHCFDITTGTLKHCAKLDSVDKIETCRKQLAPFIGPNTWHIEGDKIHFTNKEVKLDLGGVIKEYAVDQAGEIAKKFNTSALINFGGDIYVNGQKPDESNFSIALKNPKQPQQHIAVLQLCNQGLTTSAHYERSTQIEGKTYSHIINSKVDDDKTVIPEKTPPTVLSATVISNSVLTSGIYSTALMLNPTLEIDKDINIVLIDDQLRLHQNIQDTQAAG